MVWWWCWLYQICSGLFCSLFFFFFMSGCSGLLFSFTYQTVWFVYSLFACQTSPRTFAVSYQTVTVVCFTITITYNIVICGMFTIIITYKRVTLVCLQSPLQYHKITHTLLSFFTGNNVKHTKLHFYERWAEILRPIYRYMALLLHDAAESRLALTLWHYWDTHIWDTNTELTDYRRKPNRLT